MTAVRPLLEARKAIEQQVANFDRNPASFSPPTFGECGHGGLVAFRFVLPDCHNDRRRSVRVELAVGVFANGSDLPDPAGG